MDIEQYKSDLRNRIGSEISEIHVYEEIDSTNAEALRLLKEVTSDSLLITALSQTAGRGRLGRKWHSPKGAGLYLSLVNKFSRKLEGLQALSLVTALSVHEALGKFGAEGLQLKWPNDLLLGKAKLGGILLESRLQKEEVAIVFGIGINLSLPDEAKQEIDREVTDLNVVFDEAPDSITIIAGIVSSLLKNIASFEREGFEQFQSRWNSVDRYLEQDVVIQSAEQKFIGHCLGVDEKGALVLRTASGVAKITGGEIFPSLRSVSAE